MADTASSRPLLWPEIQAMLFTAMALFVFTVVVGILNGTDIVDFDQKTILTHVHAGTLGWITMAVFAASLWLFGEGVDVTEGERRLLRVLVGGAIIAIPLYGLAFLTTYGGWRPTMGVIVAAVIVGFFAWTLWRATRVELSVPHWGFLAALGTSVWGGVLGILLGLDIARDTSWLPEGGGDAHPATMVIGFLIPVGLAMSEWAFTFPRPPRFTRPGLLQMGFPFVGGIVLSLSLLLDVDALSPIAILLLIGGLVIYIRRMWGHLRSVQWTESVAGRYAIASSVFIAFNIGLAQYLVIRYEGDLDLAPTDNILALDHAMFIGVMTNAILAMLMAAARTPALRWPRFDHLFFVAVNVGLVGFIVGLLGDLTVMKQIFTPIMGVGILLALAVYATRLLAESPLVRGRA